MTEPNASILRGPDHTQYDRSQGYQHRGLWHPRVSSIIDVLNKPALPRAAAKVSATFAVANLSLLAQLGPDEAVEAVKEAPFREWRGKADDGTLIHAVAEAIVTGDAMPPGVTPNLEPRIDGFRRWLTEWPIRVLAVEVPVVNTREGYGGTLDLLIEIFGRVAVVDIKSGKAIYPVHGLQLCAYGKATHLLHLDGTGQIAEQPMPKVDGGFVLHLRDGAYSFRPVVLTPNLFETFLAARRLYAWQVEESKTTVQRGIPAPKTAPEAKEGANA